MDILNWIKTTGEWGLTVVTLAGGFVLAGVGIWGIVMAWKGKNKEHKDAITSLLVGTVGGAFIYFGGSHLLTLFQGLGQSIPFF